MFRTNIRKITTYVSKTTHVSKTTKLEKEMNKYYNIPRKDCLDYEVKQIPMDFIFNSIKK